MSIMVTALTLGLLGFVAVDDVRNFRISNAAVLGLAALFVTYMLTVGAAVSILPHVAVAVVVLLVLLLPYRLAWIGAGDVKVISVAFLWVGVDWALPFSLFFALATFVQAGLGHAGLRPAIGQPRRRKVPLGPSVASALALTLTLCATGAHI